MALTAIPGIIGVVIAALSFGALFAGLAAGCLGASIVALSVGIGLSVAGVETGPDIGLAVGMLAGLAVAGWVAGSRAVHSHRFHGMVTGLLLAFVVVAVARIGGSEAPLMTVVWLAVVSVGVAGLSGWLAGRRST